MKTGFLWINTSSPSPHCSPLVHTEEITHCLPAFPTCLDGQTAAHTVVGYIMPLKWAGDCVKPFPPWRNMFGSFFSRQHLIFTVHIDKLTPLRCLIFCQIGLKCIQSWGKEDGWISIWTGCINFISIARLKLM